MNCLSSEGEFGDSVGSEGEFGESLTLIPTPMGYTDAAGRAIQCTLGRIPILLRFEKKGHINTGFAASKYINNNSDEQQALDHCRSLGLRNILRKLVH